MKYELNTQVIYNGSPAYVYDYSPRFRTYTLYVDGKMLDGIEQHEIKGETLAQMFKDVIYEAFEEYDEYGELIYPTMLRIQSFRNEISPEITRRISEFLVNPTVAALDQLYDKVCEITNVKVELERTSIRSTDDDS